MTPGRRSGRGCSPVGYVSVVFDCDRAGREAAARIAADLKAAGMRGSIVDLARAPDGWL